MIVDQREMRIRHILTLAAMLLAAAGARAQFSLYTVEKSAELEVPLKVRHVPLKVDVINDAKAQMMRKALWRQRNLVDTKISFTGSTTQYNDAWSSNGGQNVVSGLLLAYYYHTYERNRFITTFKFDAQYGMNYIDEVWFKNQDFFKMYYLASWRLKKDGALKDWAYSFSTTFASQFATGYESRATQATNVVWSNFMAPGTLNLGAGITYTSPNAKVPFIVTVEPISGYVLFVTDDRIPDARKIKLGMTDPTKTIKAEGGSNFKLSFNRTFKFGKKQGVSLQYNTSLASFYGWITQVSRHDTAAATPAPKAILPTVDWTNAINFNPIKFLTLQFSTRTVYDRSQVDKVQMQYFLSVGLTYNYKNK